ncbi:hypothetical protein BJV78DRAFT_806677 [Lactifluus subvellereus]|nr:hypothetical protein BJV78DRAFT_806677 [Lactifluus subvellereus]
MKFKYRSVQILTRSHRPSLVCTVGVRVRKGVIRELSGKAFPYRPSRPSDSPTYPEETSVITGLAGCAGTKVACPYISSGHSAAILGVGRSKTDTVLTRIPDAHLLPLVIRLMLLIRPMGVQELGIVKTQCRSIGANRMAKEEPVGHSSMEQCGPFIFCQAASVRLYQNINGLTRTSGRTSRMSE